MVFCTIYVGIASLLQCVVSSKSNNLSFNIHHSNIFSTASFDIKRNTFNTKFGSLACAFMLAILGRCSFTKIANSIICFYRIYMVDLLLRPFSVHIKPCKPMTSISKAINGNLYITSIKNISGFLACIFSIPSTDSLVNWRAGFPCKNSSIWIIVDNATQIFLCKRFLVCYTNRSHTGQFRSWLGLRNALQRFRSPYSNPLWYGAQA